MTQRGGKRPGAGRPKGTPNRKTAAIRRAIARADDLSAERVLEEIRRLAFADVRGLFDEHGQLRPLHELTPEQSAAIASLEVIKRNLTAGDGEVDTIHKLKVWDKTKALEMLAKHFALLTEKVDHSGEIRIVHELPE